MNIFKFLYYKITIPRLAERQLEYLVNEFEAWHKENHPELSAKEALKIYPGIPKQQLLDNVK